jgi:hypothetical protein
VSVVLSRAVVEVVIEPILVETTTNKTGDGQPRSSSMLRALTVAALLAMPAPAFAHGGGGHGGGSFGGGHFGGGHMGAFHGAGFHNGFHNGHFDHFARGRFFFGPGFGYGYYGGSSCWAWTPVGWQWVCGY